MDLYVSLKYETNGADDCISGITGYDLCKMLLIAKILSVFCFVLFWLLLIFKNKILGKQPAQKNIFQKIKELFSSRKNHFDRKNYPQANWTKEQLFEYNLIQNQMTEPEEEYTNKKTTRFQDFIIDETLNEFDLQKLASLNGIKLQIRKGWYTLLKNYIIELDKLGWNRRVGCIKEKYAKLAFGFGDAIFENSEPLSELEEKFEQASTVTCETCGKMGKQRYDSSWYYVACREHYFTGHCYISSNEKIFTIREKIHSWEEVAKIEIELGYSDKPRMIIFVFKDDSREYLLVGSFGFGKFIEDSPKDIWEKSNNINFSDYYKNPEFCKVCGFESFYNYECEICEYKGREYYIGIGLYDNKLSEEQELEDIKEEQILWYKDGAEIIYKNQKTYKLNPNYQKLFSEKEYKDYIIGDEEDDYNLEEIYEFCNRNKLNLKL